jgi:hypothetical protein
MEEISMSRFIRIFAFLLLAATLGHTAMVRAQIYGGIDISIPMANTGFILSQQIVTAAYDSPTEKKSAPPKPPTQKPEKPVSTMIIRNAASASTAPQLLAGSYPAEARADARKLFVELLGKYDPLMQQLGQPRDDYAVAAAAFIAGSHSAYHGRDFDDRMFAPLVQDVRARLSANPRFGAATSAEKQAAFDQFAILGLMTATTQMAIKQMPAGAERDAVQRNLREAGGRYLEQIFGMPPDQVAIGVDGLQF